MLVQLIFFRLICKEKSARRTSQSAPTHGTNYHVQAGSKVPMTNLLSPKT